MPNEGTSIRLSLPRVPQAATDTGLSGDESDISASIGPVSAARAEHGMMLVISEHDDDLAERRDELAPVGFSLASATNGQEALTIARDMEPSVILLDAGMPGLKSWAMLNRLKQEPTMAEIPVVLFSTDESGERGLCLGPVDFIQKPLAPNDLLRVINRTLQGSASGTILVIDDDIAVREWIRGNLLTSGWKIQTAHGGPDAMKMIWNQRPALVIADLLMPRMDGFEFLTTLRARAAMRQLPVVLMSSIDLDKPRQDELGTRLLRTLAINAQPRDEWLGDVRSAIMAATRGQ